MVGFVARTIRASRRSERPRRSRSATFPERLDVAASGRWIRELGIRHVTVHVGFRARAGAPTYRGVLDRIGEMADVFHKKGLSMAWRPARKAQRPRPAMKDVGRDYFTSTSTRRTSSCTAPTTLSVRPSFSPLTSMMHIKDGAASEKPGEIFGRETPIGKAR